MIRRFLRYSAAAKDEREPDLELVRLVAYIFEDEDAALEKEAKHKRPSKSEIVRRVLRRFLGLGD